LGLPFPNPYTITCLRRKKKRGKEREEVEYELEGGGKEQASMLPHPFETTTAIVMTSTVSSTNHPEKLIAVP